jgi:hypothetical protein
MYQNCINTSFAYNIPRLLHASGIVRHEASLLFYVHNRFDLTSATPKRIDSFVPSAIARNNAGYMSVSAFWTSTIESQVMSTSRTIALASLRASKAAALI